MSGDGVRIDATDAPDPDDRAAVLAALVAFNERAAAPSGVRPLALLLRDGTGTVVGGLWGRSAYDWLFVELLVVPDALRGRGLGAALMRGAEAEAAARGLVGIWLDTFSFQARPFYERLGFRAFGTLADHPRGGARHFLCKRLDGT